MYIECHCDFLSCDWSLFKSSSSGGFSLEETSSAISARVLAWKVPDRLMTMGMILKYAFRVPWVWSASLSGS